MEPTTQLTSYDRLKQSNDLLASKADEARQHQDMLDMGFGTQQTILEVAKSFVEFLNNHTSKTEVINQLTHIGTPDAFQVVDAVNQLEDTLKQRPTTDLSEIASLLKGVLEQTQAIPKELPEEKEQQFVDYTNRFESLEKVIKSVEQAVKDQETTVEAPKVEVKPADVHVEQTDLTPLSKDMQAVEKAIKANKLPDVVPVQQTNSLINFEFDRYKVVYDSFDDNDDRPESTIYYLGKKKVATITYSYNSSGSITGAKRT